MKRKRVRCSSCFRRRQDGPGEERDRGEPGLQGSEDPLSGFYPDTVTTSIRICHNIVLKKALLNIYSIPSAPLSITQLRLLAFHFLTIKPYLSLPNTFSHYTWSLPYQLTTAPPSPAIVDSSPLWAVELKDRVSAAISCQVEETGTPCAQTGLCMFWQSTQSRQMTGFQFTFTTKDMGAQAKLK